MHGADDEAAHMGYHPVSWVRTATDDAMTDVIADNTSKERIRYRIRILRESRRFDTRRNYYIAVNKRFARTSACFLLVAAVALSLFLPSHDRTVMPDQASVLQWRTSSAKWRTAPPGSVMRKKPKYRTPCRVRYTTLMVGTFATEEEADRFIAMRQDCGYELESVGGKRLWRVSAVKDSDRKNLCQYSEFQRIQRDFQGSVDLE